MTVSDFDPTRVHVTFGGMQISSASDEPITVRPMSKPFEITLKSDSEGAAAMMDLLRVDSSRCMPLPVVISDRRRPKRRRHARGGLRRMVRRRVMSAVLHGIEMSGGVDAPLTITAECIRRRKT